MAGDVAGTIDDEEIGGAVYVVELGNGARFCFAVADHGPRDRVRRQELLDGWRVVIKGDGDELQSGFVVLPVKLTE